MDDPLAELLVPSLGKAGWGNSPEHSCTSDPAYQGYHFKVQNNPLPGLPQASPGKGPSFESPVSRRSHSLTPAPPEQCKTQLYLQRYKGLQAIADTMCLPELGGGRPRLWLGHPDCPQPALTGPSARELRASCQHLALPQLPSFPQLSRASPL